MNRLDEAKEHALLALPVFDIANEILAEIALRQDNLEEAKEYSQEAVARRGLAEDAASLIALLEASPLFGDVRFRSATTRVQAEGRTLESFALVFRRVPTA